jgi:hypothetical protein
VEEATAITTAIAQNARKAYDSSSSAAALNCSWFIWEVAAIKEGEEECG